MSSMDGAAAEAVEVAGTSLVGTPFTVAMDVAIAVLFGGATDDVALVAVPLDPVLTLLVDVLSLGAIGAEAPDAWVAPRSVDDAELDGSASSPAWVRVSLHAVSNVGQLSTRAHCVSQGTREKREKRVDRMLDAIVGVLSAQEPKLSPALRWKVSPRRKPRHAGSGASMSHPHASISAPWALSCGEHSA